MPRTTPKINRFSHYQNGKYFEEGLKISNPPRFKRVVFGRLNDVDQEKSTHHLIDHGPKSKYCGWVFHTEHHDEKWTLAKNASFFEGAIQAKKTFHLITNIEDCIKAELYKFNKYMEQNSAFFFLNPNAHMHRIKGSIGVTFFEILWMLDHHYSYRISRNNPLETVFEPSPQTPNTTTMVDYFPNNWTPADWQIAVIARLSQIMQHINEQREAFQNTPQKRMGAF